MAKVDRSVVRNAAYRKGEFSIRERHNERQNESYFNGDIMLDRAHLNVHFKKCDTTYEQEFNRMVEDGTISLRGLKPDAKVFDELVFDVNTAYFDRNGGYEYAKSFFEEAYRLAVEEVGGEEYILSAVMHADERNKAESERLGRDVFHYHLHVVYVPVVDKEVKWTKRCKDPALVGTVKEVIKQVSHSKKWPRFKGENGKWINSYSLLQDRFYEHMRAAGYTDFERGERGSTAEHLSVLEFKTKKEAERVAILGQQVEKKQHQLDHLEKKTAVVKQEVLTFSDIDRMGEKRTMLGDVAVSQSDWKVVSSLAKKGVKANRIIAELKEKIASLLRKITGLEKRLEQYQGKSLTDTMRYYQALQRAPRRIKEVIADVMRKPPEKQEKMPTRQRNQELER
ncbi:MAG: plasmid recombination protein [Oscillospiraceae bacterium]|nr:plasmid recombination protein [Oscillospiraceae bacterium]